MPETQYYRHDAPESPVTATHYYRRADGVLASQSVAGVPLPDLPDGATALTEEEYEAELAQIRAEREEHAARLLAQDQERIRVDYEALRTAGIPEATAARLTGHVEEVTG